MRLVCHLPTFRGDRSISQVARETGIAVGTLSRIERGLLLPLDKQIAPLEQAYGKPWTEWYSRLSLAAIQEDEGA